MPDDMEPSSQKQVTLIPTDRVRVLNPRVRNRRTFEAMVENIARIGLKRPITVAPRAGTDPQEYDLVCGQGRLEAFIELKQYRIPAIVIEADESDCLVMSLVENCARRQHMRTAMVMSGTRPVSRRMRQRSDPAAVAVQRARTMDTVNSSLTRTRSVSGSCTADPPCRVMPAMVSATTCGCACRRTRLTSM